MVWSTNITTLGTITGTWQGGKITDSFINSATTWNDKQDALTFTDTSLTSGNVVIMNGTANVNDIAVFTATGIKGSSDIKTSIGLDQVDNTSDLDKPISTAVQTALDTKQDELINGIANTNNVTINSVSVASGDFAKFTISVLEGRNVAETKEDLILDLVENTALSTWEGTDNIVNLGTITNADTGGGALHTTGSVATTQSATGIYLGLDNVSSDNSVIDICSNTDAFSSLKFSHLNTPMAEFKTYNKTTFKR